jgi:membrane protease YdiL (CAAX protease family)
MQPTETSPPAAVQPPARRAGVAPGRDERRLARRLIATYLVLTALGSSVWYLLMFRAGTINAAHGLYVFGMMWSPGLSALASRLIWQHNLRGQGWGWGGTRWQLLSYAIPVLYATVAYGAVWLLGLGAFRAPAGGSLLRTLATLATLGTVMSCTSALGEELGWRGLLVPELAKLTSFTKLSLISGVIWAAWHMPAIFLLNYNAGSTPPLYGAACFFVMVVGISFVFAWLRLRSGSVWTGMFLHASHNLWVQAFFDRVTVDTGHTRWFTTEFGAALAIAAVVVALVFWRLRGRLPAHA